MRANVTNQRGTTLIESLFALTLFGLTASAVGNLLVEQVRMQGWNTYRTNAIAIASGELEDLRSMDYNSIPSARSSTIAIGGMTYSVSTVALADTPASGMKQITTTVSFTEPTGPKSYTLNAIYTAIKR